MKRASQIFILVLLFIFGLSQSAGAGFGISSPYVNNDRLVPGSHYEKEITLVRGDSYEDWNVEIRVDVPNANDWFSVDKGKEFIMPKGERVTKVLIIVDVPENTRFGKYQGKIIVRTNPLKTPSGVVSIALGAQVDVDLEVIKAEIFDFAVSSIKTVDIIEGHKWWLFNFPTKIKLLIRIENLGNIWVAPSKVQIDLYDNKGNELLESVETTKMKKVKPFGTGEIVAEMTSSLNAGSYQAYFKIFKNDEIINEGETHISIIPYVAVPLKDKEFLGLNFLIWAGIGLVVLTGIGYGGYKGYKKYKARKKKKPVEKKKKPVQRKYKPRKKKKIISKKYKARKKKKPVQKKYKARKKKKAEP